MIRSHTPIKHEVRIDHPLVKNNPALKRYHTIHGPVEDARAFEKNVLAYLARGRIPDALIRPPNERKRARSSGTTLSDAFTLYREHTNVKASEKALLATIEAKHGTLTVAVITEAWIRQWIEDMKRVDNISPTTIKHRVGALSRCFRYLASDHSDKVPFDPFEKPLRRGYAEYSPKDQTELKKRGLRAKVNKARNRRLHDGEQEAILKVIDETTETVRVTVDGVQFQRVQRRFTDAERVFFVLATETAMRMREMYTITTASLHLKASYVHLDKTKNGDERNVPLTKFARDTLANFVESRKAEIEAAEGRLFPYWSGLVDDEDPEGGPDEEELNRTTSRVSQLFAQIFKLARCKELHFHDLRHEAVCRLFLNTDLDGLEIAKITGHKTMDVLLQYLSLRGSDPAPTWRSRAP